jgi:hypothetical protein
MKIWHAQETLTAKWLDDQRAEFVSQLVVVAIERGGGLLGEVPQRGDMGPSPNVGGDL